MCDIERKWERVSKAVIVVLHLAVTVLCLMVWFDYPLVSSLALIAVAMIFGAIGLALFKRDGFPPSTRKMYLRFSIPVALFGVALLFGRVKVGFYACPLGVILSSLAMLPDLVQQLSHPRNRL